LWFEAFASIDSRKFPIVAISGLCEIRIFDLALVSATAARGNTRISKKFWRRISIYRVAGLRLTAHTDFIPPRICGVNALSSSEDYSISKT
jgi:hypothetical protein